MKSIRPPFFRRQLVSNLAIITFKPYSNCIQTTKMVSTHRLFCVNFESLVQTLTSKASDEEQDHIGVPCANESVGVRCI